MADDFYEQWYTNKLWQMLPTVYRTLDASEQLDGSQPTATPGPLWELIARIGAQAAVLRRSIDRLWENQSIETCDDWVIPYIGDLLATRLVSCLDARAQRLDVAKTIYYRRRAGTLGLIEELASDIAGHDARAVEFFRRLARTRHLFDPPIGLTPGLSSFTKAQLLTGPPPPAVIEGLSGPFSRTPAGGYADLRNAHGAASTGTAFDEFSYTADFRAGRQSIGWQNISHLGVFVWWLYAFKIYNATPVEWPECPGQFTFDPTGREIPLFTPSARAREDFADNWVAPNEWELPMAVRATLWELLPEAFYPDPTPAPTAPAGAFAIGLGLGGAAVIQPPTLFHIDPEMGRFRFLGARSPGPIAVTYAFGFSSTIGACGEDPGTLPAPTVAPSATIKLNGAQSLDTALDALIADATVQFTDSSTFTGPVTDPWGHPSALSNLVLTAIDGERPVLRWTSPGTWTLTGNGGSLVMQGLWLQGADLTLAGVWEEVELRLCTVDPGTADLSNVGHFLKAIDGVILVPSHIFITGQVNVLTLRNCITGPIRCGQGGTVAKITVNDSIVQSIPTSPPGIIGTLYDPADLAARLNIPNNSDAATLRAALGSSGLTDLEAYTKADLGKPVSNPLLHDLTAALAALTPAQAKAALLAFPLALADLALGADSGVVNLARTTVLGPTVVHQLSASECILDEVATVDDPQEGCVRFSTLATGNNLHKPYRCATVPVRGPIFQSRRFSDPGYARLRADADRAIIAGTSQTQTVPSVLYGAANGAQPGAFRSEAQALAQRGLAQKIEEFAPISLTPVWVDADL
jgi:hypothetical protein